MANPRIIYDNLWRKGTALTPSSENPQHPASDTQIDTLSMFWRTTSLATPDFIPCDLGVFPPAGIGTMNFTSGSVEPQVGEWLFGVGASGKVVSVNKSDGIWGDGDAVGSIELEQCEGCFNDDETIRGSIGGANILTVNHPDGAVGVDKHVKNGAFVHDLNGPADWTASATAVVTTEAGGQVGNCMKVLNDVGINQYAFQYMTAVIGRIYTVGVYAKKAGADAKVFVGSSGDDPTNDDYMNETEDAGDWTLFTVTFIATTTSVNITCYSIGVNLSHAFFDEVTLFESDEDDTGKTVDFIAILGHNFSQAVVITAIGSMTSDFSDTGEEVVIPYHESNIFYFFPSAITRRYWKVQVSDTDNPDSYIQIANVICGSYFELNKTVGLSYEEGYEDFSELGYSDSQVIFSQEKEIIEVRSLPFRGLDDATRANILLFFNECGIHKAFVICFDSSAANTNSYWVMNTEMTPPRYEQNDCWHWQLTTREVI